MWRKDKIEDDLRYIDSHSWQTEDDKQEFTKAYWLLPANASDKNLTRAI